jgi:CheY-like chemotaxis protein
MEKIKIVMVDDNIDFLEVIGERIKGWGYHLIRATTGKERPLS